jgi:hypothetical protein
MSAFIRTTAISVMLAPAAIILVAGAGALVPAVCGSIGAGALLLVMRRFDAVDSPP